MHLTQIVSYRVESNLGSESLKGVNQGVLPLKTVSLRILAMFLKIETSSFYQCTSLRQLLIMFKVIQGQTPWWEYQGVLPLKQVFENLFYVFEDRDFLFFTMLLTYIVSSHNESNFGPDLLKGVNQGVPPPENRFLRIVATPYVKIPYLGPSGGLTLKCFQLDEILSK